MKILLIEDDDEKIKKISSFLDENIYKGISIVSTKSYNSSLVELAQNNDYNYVLMDMSMPTYDVEEGFEDDDTESFAGRDLLEQMKFRKISYPTIIITQYDTFGEHVDKLDLDELKEELSDRFFPNYRATVYYNSAENDWKFHLNEEINKIINEVGTAND